MLPYSTMLHPALSPCPAVLALAAHASGITFSGSTAQGVCQLLTDQHASHYTTATTCPGSSVGPTGSGAGSCTAHAAASPWVKPAREPARERRRPGAVSGKLLAPLWPASGPCLPRPWQTQADSPQRALRPAALPAPLGSSSVIRSTRSKCTCRPTGQSPSFRGEPSIAGWQVPS